MYGETLGRWRTADLLIGLAYLARQGGEEHPCADVAALGRPMGTGQGPEQRAAALVGARMMRSQAPSLTREALLLQVGS